MWPCFLQKFYAKIYKKDCGIALYRWLIFHCLLSVAIFSGEQKITCLANFAGKKNKTTSILIIYYPFYTISFRIEFDTHNTITL